MDKADNQRYMHDESLYTSALADTETVQEKQGHLHYLHFRWKLVNVSMENSIASMETSVEDMEAIEASMVSSTFL